MVSSVPPYEDELSNSAYANISLIADRAWTFDKEDPYHKLNYSLWIQYCKVAGKYKEEEKCRLKRVRDLIPDSHLARYANYEYSYERERLYKPDNDSARFSGPSFCWTEVTEPWMLPEVEEHFARIVSRPCTNQQNRSSNQKNLDEQETLALKPEENRFPKSILTGNACNPHRYSIESPAEMELHARVTCRAVRDLWNPAKLRQLVEESCRANQLASKQQPRPQPQPQQERSTSREQGTSSRVQQQQRVYCSFEYPVMYTESCGSSRKALAPNLSPEVPEFFPKMSQFQGAKEPSCANRVQYFPSLNERSYQNELFPYNRLQEYPIYQSGTLSMLPAETSAFVRPPHWFQKVVPPPTGLQIQISVPSSTPLYTSLHCQPLRTATPTHRPLQVQGTFYPGSNSGHLSPTPIPVYQRPIELYHETQRKKNQGVDFNNLILLTKNVIKCHRSGRAKSSQKKSLSLFETKKESNVLAWQEKGRLPKSSELVDPLLGAQRLEKPDWPRSNVWKEIDDSGKTLEGSRTGSELPKSRVKIVGKVQEDTDSSYRKRLYRDVLTNASASEPLDQVFEKRYEELEQQAMEQYRNSEESLALKYQELEQQAMDQYKNSNNGQETSTSYSANIEKELELEEKCYRKTGCSDGKKCSGFGRCSPVKEIEKTEGSFSQITLLKSESKSETNMSKRSTQIRTGRSTLLSKSLTMLSENEAIDSKNLCRGASGDKIDRKAKASPKRRLILMSPFEQRSEAKIAKTTNSNEIYCISQGNKNNYRYHNDVKIDKKKDVDENTSIIQSPRTEVWLSGFWTT